MEPWFTKRHKGRLVKIKLTYRTETIEGVVLDFSTAWVLLAVVKDYQLDGYKVIRNQGIERVIMGKRQRFGELVLAQRGMKVSAPQSIPLDLLEGLLADLTARYGVFGLEEERDDMWWLGSLQSYSAKALVINDLDPKGLWKTRSFQPWRIRMVEFGSDYINALKFIDGLRQSKRWDAKAKLKFVRPSTTAKTKNRKQELKTKP